jgi:hypothetical protein
MMVMSMFQRKSAAVPVVPNESLVRGKVMSIKQDAGAGGAEWQVTIKETRPVGNSPDFVQAYIGKTISVFVARGAAGAVAENDMIEAHLAYRGDERGGRFVLVGDGVRKL